MKNVVTFVKSLNIYLLKTKSVPKKNHSWSLYAFFLIHFKILYIFFNYILKKLCIHLGITRVKKNIGGI